MPVHTGVNWRPLATGSTPVRSNLVRFGDVASNEELRALGRFTYEFSRLVTAMRIRTARMVELIVQDRGPLLTQLLMMHTGEMTAGQIINLFFGVAETVGEYTEDEARMAKRLRTRTLKFNDDRNAFMHGDWSMGWSVAAVGGEHQLLPATLSRTLPGRKGSKATHTPWSVEALDTFTDELVDLYQVITEWGALVARVVRYPDEEPLRPGDIYAMKESEVVRQGPEAERVPPFTTVPVHLASPPRPTQ